MMHAGQRQASTRMLFGPDTLHPHREKYPPPNLFEKKKRRKNAPAAGQTPLARVKSGEGIRVEFVSGRISKDHPAKTNAALMMRKRYTSRARLLSSDPLPMAMAILPH